jgi:LuxR family maltose regulon positive regulatory protein
MCTSGAEQMRAEADRAIATLPATSHWRPSAVVLRTVALVLLGDKNADESLAAAIEVARRSRSSAALVLALSERALLAADRGDAAEAGELATTAEGVVREHGLEAYACNALRLAASARAKLRAGNWQAARQDLDAAHQLIPTLTDALPWLTAQTQLELARASLAMRDAAAARALLADLDRSSVQVPRFEALRSQRAALVAELASVDLPSEGRSSGLTDAELRLLPLLATHLSFREIGERLFVSRNTIKTQAISVYRKLGVSSRSDAIDRAAQLGLIATSPEL